MLLSTLSINSHMSGEFPRKKRVTTLSNPIILYTHPIILLYYDIIYFKYDRTSENNPTLTLTLNLNLILTVTLNRTLRSYFIIHYNTDKVTQRTDQNTASVSAEISSPVSNVKASIRINARSTRQKMRVNWDDASTSTRRWKRFLFLVLAPSQCTPQA